MVIGPFHFAKCPSIHFGPGKIKQLSRLAGSFGNTALLITGGRSLMASGRFDEIHHGLKQNGRVFHEAVKGEPTPDLVDRIVDHHADNGIRVVAAVGGGSVVDCAKAVSAMLTQTGSVLDYLEGVGNKIHDGRKIPFIAAPTTSGTGSEATKNAVISKVGENGFKKSLRHDNLVPDLAILDPELALSCPPNITAACGMDALTQLLESYVSTQASPMTDALALSGLTALSGSLLRAFTHGSEDVSARANMAYASCLSGITLANAGLGVVHGLGGPMGGFFPIPHGVACAALLATATEATIRELQSLGDPNHPALIKYAKAGAILSGAAEVETAKGCELLVQSLHRMTNELAIPRLGEFGITRNDLDKIVDAGGNKNNPLKLDGPRMKAILMARL